MTGGANGIGAAIVERFLQEGARVCLLDRDVDAALSEGAQHADKLIAVRGDVRSPADNEAAVNVAREAFGGLDIFVGNAGIFDYGRPVEKYDLEVLRTAVDEIFSVNVGGYLLGVAAALPLLRLAEAPTVILTASNAGLYAGGGGPLYTASKHAVVGLVRQLAYDLAPEIRVNGVAPGGTITRLSGLETLGKSDLHLDEMDGAARYIASGVPLRFAARPSDHASLYVLLASPTESRAVTGAIFPSDGGLEVRGNRGSRL